MKKKKIKQNDTSKDKSIKNKADKQSNGAASHKSNDRVTYKRSIQSHKNVTVGSTNQGKMKKSDDAASQDLRNSQNSIITAGRLTRLSDNKSTRQTKTRHSRKESTDPMSNKSRSDRRSSRSCTPNVKKTNASAKSRGSTKSAKSRKRSVNSKERIINIESYKRRSIDQKEDDLDLQKMQE